MKIKQLDRSPYQPIWSAMKDFALTRTPDTEDELWIVEHDPVFTQGLAGKAEHVLNPGDIPIVQTDRGGQVTYHGPGQLMAYTLFDIERLQLNTRSFVVALEKTVIDCLATYGIAASGCRDRPGVYVNDAKICSIGLRIKRGYAYHGLALNVSMDLAPFQRINPCGFASMAMTQIADFVPGITLQDVAQSLTDCFKKNFIVNVGNYC